MDFKVLITDTALADLREIVEFVAHDDPQAAARVGEKLIARALSLATGTVHGAGLNFPREGPATTITTAIHEKTERAEEDRRHHARARVNAARRGYQKRGAEYPGDDAGS